MLVLACNRAFKTHQCVYPWCKLRFHAEFRVSAILATAISNTVINHHDLAVIPQVYPTTKRAQKRIGKRQGDGKENSGSYDNHWLLDGLATSEGFEFDCHFVSIDIEKLTNGVDADDSNAGDAPQIAPGDTVTWTYRVTNTGNVTLLNLEVEDDQEQEVSCPKVDLDPGETIDCTASAPAEDLADTSFTTVPGLCGGVLQSPLYENMGTATGQSESGTFVQDQDPSHYCNPHDEDEDGIPDDQDECPDTVIPEFVPTKKLGTNRFALVDGDTTFDTKAPKGKGPRKAFTVEDTAGCSCEQIIEEMGLGKGHKKFGCSISAMEEWIDAVNAAPVLCDNIRHINKLTLVWDGTGVIHVTTELGQEINGITPGDVIVLDTEGAGNDLWITISGAIVGESTFHLSCSDEDMNGPEDCGKVQGNGKTSNPSLINDWLFAGMEGENGILECSP